MGVKYDWCWALNFIYKSPRCRILLNDTKVETWVKNLSSIRKHLHFLLMYATILYFAIKPLLKLHNSMHMPIFEAAWQIH
ncbi:unnamed protein product [Blepharisma stoltei]|uniref:Uncharacterized protein n=1 Tax=Blepharisma stoltei TaxID=1481888 RepID=A0AAU9J4W5_9CILI|nr:unnamed protein product [Blepharisma stoltei]